MRPVLPHNSSIVNIEAKYMILITYLGAILISGIPVIGSFASWLVPLLVFLLEKDSSFLRFHAMQNLLLQLVLLVVSIIMAIVAGGTFGFGFAMFTNLSWIFSLTIFAVIFSLIALIIYLGILVLLITAIVKGYHYFPYKIPFIGNVAAKWSGFQE